MKRGMIRATIPGAMLVGALALTAGCGSRTALKPLPGMTAVPRAAAAKNAQTPTELMTPSTQARPDRTVDLRTRSAERQDDPFDTPPGMTPSRPTDADAAPSNPAGSSPADAPARGQGQ